MRNHRLQIDWQRRRGRVGRRADRSTRHGSSRFS